MGYRKRHAATTARALAVAAALATGAAAAGAQELKQQARNAAVGDGLSTAVGLAVGAAELGPAGALLSIGMKAATFQYVDSLPEVRQPRAYAIAASTWSGTTVGNVCITASLLTGGGFVPVCLVAGVAWGMKTWQESEDQRQFWEHCAMLRTYTGEPEFECTYVPPRQLAAAADEGFITAQALQAP